MIDRNSVRDTWKLEHWDEYVKTIDYSIPEALKKMSSCLDLMLFYNSSDEEYQKSMEMVISRLEDEERLNEKSEFCRTSFLQSAKFSFYL